MSSETLTAVLFVTVVLITVGITFWASRQNSGAADFYAGGRQFSGFQNGMAVSGDYMSAASFLGISGLISLNGYDGFLYSIGFLVAWLVALLLVAELLRNTGRFTMADVLSFRLKQRPVRMAAALATLTVCFFYLVAQMAGAGGRSETRSATAVASAAVVTARPGRRPGPHRCRAGRPPRSPRHPSPTPRRPSSGRGWPARWPARRRPRRTTWSPAWRARAAGGSNRPR